MLQETSYLLHGPSEISKKNSVLLIKFSDQLCRRLFDIEKRLNPFFSVGNFNHLVDYYQNCIGTRMVFSKNWWVDKGLFSMNRIILLNVSFSKFLLNVGIRLIGL